MSTRVFTGLWTITPFLRGLCTQLYSSASADVLEQLPREELVTKFKSRLRGRQFLPGASGADFPEFLAEPRDSLPLGVRVTNPKQSSLTELTVACMQYVKENLSQCPAILFRGLPSKTSEDFSIIARAIPFKTMNYVGGNGPKDALDKEAGVYIASDEPDCYTVEMHNEMVYSDVFPSKLFFYCAKEPADGCGGETALLKNSELLSKLDPDVVKKLDKKQIRYERYMPDSRGNYMTWQSVFRTENREDAERHCKQQGNNIRWYSSGDLYLWHNRPACIPHPVSGEKIFFNQAASHHNSYHKAMSTFIDADIPDE